MLSAAIVYHSQTKRYQIAAVGSVVGVYLVDTRTGDISICSPVSNNGCMSLQEFREFVEQRNIEAKNKVKNYAKEKAGSVIDSFKNLDFMDKEQEFTPDKGQP
jgi:hypothetical protein